MKLVDILARELKEWPGSRITAITQSCVDAELYGENPLGEVIWRKSLTSEECSPNRMGDDRQRVTRAQWQAAVDALKANQEKVMVIDWSNAPEGATHFGRGRELDYWVKIEGDKQYFINIARKDSGRWKISLDPDDPADLIARQKVTPVWNGEGLPPAGTTCEHGTGNAWGECTVLHVGSLYMLIAANGREEVPIYHSSFCFRPIRTAEQIAAQARSKACDEMFGIMSSPPVREGNRSDMAEALYDAGYRKFEIVES